MSEAIETWFDQPLLFTIAERHVRGRLVRLGPTLRTIIAAHNYPPVAEKLLAEALVLTVLLGSTLKDENGQMTLQAQTGGGPVELLVCDYRGGELRGYLKFDAERLAEVGPEPTLFALFGEGFLAITFDQATTGERYQGIVPLEGASIGEAAEHYFEQSEQISSLIKLAARHDAEAGCLAGGLLLQHLPEGEVVATGSTSAMTIPNGTMRARSPRRSRTRNLPIPRRRSKRSRGDCSTRTKCASRRAWRCRAAAGAARAILPVSWRSSPRPNARIWPTMRAISSSTAPFVRGFSRSRSTKFRQAPDPPPPTKRCELTPSG